MSLNFPFKKICEVCENLDSKRIPITQNKRIAGDIPYYGASGIVDYVNDFIFDEELLLVSEDGANLIARTYPIAFSISGKTWVNNHAHVLKFKSYVSQKFIEYYLNSIKLDSYVSGMAQPKLNQKSLNSIKVPFPNIETQKQIVTILDKAFTVIDQAKANIERNIENAKELFQSALSKAFCGELSHKSFSRNNLKTDLDQLLAEIKNVARNNGRKSEVTKGHEIIKENVPDDWQFTSIESIFNIIDYRGKTPKKSKEGKRLISAKNIRNGFIDENPVEYISEDNYTKWMVRGFPKLGDILFVTEGHTMGFCAINNRTDEFALAQRTITLQPVLPINTKFVFYYMLSPYFQKIIQVNATGAAAVGIKASKFKSLPVPYPMIEEQQEIVSKLDFIHKKSLDIISIKEKELELVEELKKSILQKAFSGELTANDAILEDLPLAAEPEQPYT